MSSTDIVLPADRLARVRRLYPGAICTGTVTGTRHLVTAEVRKMERRGEIIAMERFARDLRGGVRVIPYVRLIERGVIRRRQALNLGALTLAGVLVATGVGWLVWESRYVLMIVAAAAGVVSAVLLAPHLRRGCLGIHCSGCRG